MYSTAYNKWRWYLFIYILFCSQNTTLVFWQPSPMLGYWPLFSGRGTRSWCHISGVCSFCVKHLLSLMLAGIEPYRILHYPQIQPATAWTYLFVPVSFEAPELTQYVHIWVCGSVWGFVSFSGYFHPLPSLLRLLWTWRETVSVVGQLHVITRHQFMAFKCS